METNLMTFDERMKALKKVTRSVRGEDAETAIDLLSSAIAVIISNEYDPEHYASIVDGIADDLKADLNNITKSEDYE